MAHKRNPVLSMLALEAAQRVPGLAATLLAQLTAEHERGLGQWQSQWFTLRELALCASSAIAAMAEALGALEIDEAAMRRNLATVPPEPMGSAGAMIERALEEWTIARGTAP
jgi:3-carboxy-cis,cis-muconate cycloisomerase